MTAAVIAAAPREPSYLAYRGRYSGILGWIFSLDHKRIGVMYLIAQAVFFLVGASLGVTMRLQLMRPDNHLVQPQVYNALFTLHGVIMIFLFVIPSLSASFGNFFLPILIGAKDVSFPKLNLMSWYLFMIGAVVALMSLFTGNGPPDTGWTFYVPYSIRTSTNVVMGLTGVFIIGFSSILTGLNFITTVHRLRAPGMSWFRMPLFVWALYATAWIQVLATPILGITLALVVVERLAGVGIFDPAKGGDPILYQHLFWIYSHPAVYIMILPAMGAITEIIPTFSHRTIFGYKAIAMSSMAIALLGSLVWGHHMFVSGQSDVADITFSLLTFLVAIPSAVKVFNWTATLYKGSIVLEAPMLYALSFIFLFSIGGRTGLMQGALAVDVHLHDTAFIVGHFHYVMFGGTGFGFFAALHYWFPKMFGRSYSDKVARLAWGILFVGFNTLYFPFLILGWLGMPRRYYTYSFPQFASLEMLSTVGSWILVTGILLMVGNFLHAALKGARAEDNPWGGVTLDWKIPSPPPLENFEQIPVITQGPYDGFEGQAPR